MVIKDVGAHKLRFVSLTGGHNFRDIGGYATANGPVATGRVFRAATLAFLTVDDQQIISEIGIRAVCDLRTNSERQHRPSRLPSNVTSWARDHERGPGNLLELIGEGLSAERSRELMTALYRKIAFEQADSIAKFFRLIASGTLPLLVHCTAGKDRTGAAVALLMDWLGVSRMDIAADYALTDRFFDKTIETITLDHGDSLLPKFQIEDWAPLMRADTAYIEAMFAAVEDMHGSVEGFLQDTLHLNSQTLASVRENLLTP